MADSKLTTVTFQLLSDTKGAQRYQEVDDKGNPRTGDSDGAVIGSLYLRKMALAKLNKGTPKKFRCTLEAIPE